MTAVCGVLQLGIMLDSRDNERPPDALRAGVEDTGALVSLRPPSLREDTCSWLLAPSPPGVGTQVSAGIYLHVCRADEQDHHATLSGRAHPRRAHNVYTPKLSRT